MKRILTGLFLIFTLAAVPASADVTLPKMFSDNMVLQRDLPVPVFGTATPGEEVAVTFAGNTVKTKADADGKWIVRLPKMVASEENRVLEVKGQNTLELKDVLVGEVWLCSGQSNMAMIYLASRRPVSGEPDEPMIRIIRVENAKNAVPAADIGVEVRWTACQEKRADRCTAVGYFFAKRLRDVLGVPVGIIDCGWGGSGIDPWIPSDIYKDIPELDFRIAEIKQWEDGYADRTQEYIAKMEKWLPEAKKTLAEGNLPPYAPPNPQVYDNTGTIFNGMVAPVIPYAIRGVLWYQGEANAGDHSAMHHYNIRQKALVEGWRKHWNQPGNARDFPFYYVQLAAFMRPSDNPGQNDGWNHLRDQQTLAMKVVRNTGMAVTIDIGDAGDIHPRNKYDVGLRLAAWALAKDYGKGGVFCGPMYQSMKVEGNKIRLAFDHTGGGLIAGAKDDMKPVETVADGKLKRFSIAGEDKKWYWADAVVDGNTVVVSSPDVPNPVAVRYAWSNNPEGCNLYNKEGFPACPFRTDDW